MRYRIRFTYLKFIRLLVLLLIVCSAPTWALQDKRVFRKGTIIYIHSKLGLSLRKDSSINAKRIGKIPYGTRLKLIQYAPMEDTYQADHIQGYWIKVKYKKQEGFVFSGFISNFPTPDTNSTLEQYAKKLEHLKIKTTFSTSANAATAPADTGNETRLTLKHATVLDGLLLARGLFHIPQRLKPPTDSSVRKITVLDAQKPKHILTRELNFIHNKKHKIRSIEYIQRQEGAGQTSRIQVIAPGKIQLQHQAFRQ